MGKRWIILASVVAAALIIGAYFVFVSNDDEIVEPSTATDTTIKEPAEEVVEPEKVLLYEVTATLVDVTDTGNSMGTARAEFSEKEGYKLLAEFGNLPTLTDSEFFEGWLQDPITKDFFSTGATEIDTDGTIIDKYSSSVDQQARGYTFYILTLEPDDGDPAPATHILEGALELTN